MQGIEIRRSTWNVTTKSQANFRKIIAGFFAVRFASVLMNVDELMNYFCADAQHITAQFTALACDNETHTGVKQRQQNRNPTR